MYAIIEDSGVQTLVREGDVIRVDPRDLPEDTLSLTFDRVLMVGGERVEPRIGQPVLDGARVTADVVGEQSEKTRIYKYRRRKNSRRRGGHRQHFMQVRITGIEPTEAEGRPAA